MNKNDVGIVETGSTLDKAFNKNLARLNDKDKMLIFV